MITGRLYDIRPGSDFFLFELMYRSFASFTHDERLSFFDSQNRDEKQIKIMIHPFVVGLMKTAYRTLPGRVVQYFYFRRNTGNQKHLALATNRRIADGSLLTRTLFLASESFFDKSKARFQ